MTTIRSNVSQRAITEEDTLAALNKEIVPTVREMRAAVQRLPYHTRDAVDGDELVVGDMALVELDGANVALTAPKPVEDGYFAVKMTTVAGGNTITVNPYDAETIEGGVSYVMNTDREYAAFWSEGDSWHLLG